MVTLESLAVKVARADNRAVSFTNKASAFYYTQTHRNDHPEHAWFRGFNLAGRRVFNDYPVLIDGAALDPETADAVVRPDALLRHYPNGIVETLRLFDGIDIVEVALAGPPQLLRRADLSLSGDRHRRTARSHPRARRRGAEFRCIDPGSGAHRPAADAQRALLRPRLRRSAAVAPIRS